ncbi:MAG: serine hydrolase domain-containing protein [Gemmatimonadales bacterium]
MSRPVFAATVVLAGSLLLPFHQASQSARPSDTELRRRIETYLAPLAPTELSGTLIVARGPQIVLERSFGFAAHELRVPFTPETPTNIASITKPLTIIVTARLAEAKALSVTDTISRWLPEFVHGSRITITQLLNHRAGIPHRLVAEDQQQEPRTAMDMVRAANALPLLFEPGSKSVYSSGGYAVLAAVLERVTGKPYDELLQEHVARPAGARIVRHVDRRERLPGRALSVIPIGDGVINAPFRDLSFLVGGGSVYSTPRDIFTVMQGVLSGRYGAASRSALLRPNGLAWNGITNGYRAFADWHASDSLAVLFFANAYTGAIDLIRRDLPRIARGEIMPTPKIPRVTAVVLSEFARARIAGQYDVAGITATAAFASPRLLLFGDRALLPISDSVFFCTADYAEVTFASDSTGAVRQIEWGPGTWGTGEPGSRYPKLPGSAR